MSPSDVTDNVLAALAGNQGVVNVVVLRTASRNPAGDVLEFDVITAEANAALATLRSFQLDQRGSVAMQPGDIYLSAKAAALEGREPPAANVAPIWEEAEARIRSLGAYPPSWHVLLVIAGLIAAVGILTNSQILIVAAMVVGPEYGAIINVSLGWNEHDPSRRRAATRALVIGFALAIAASVVFGLVIRAFDLQPRAFEAGVRPVSSLINTPNVYSVVVACLAGVVGVVSLTEARANTLIGVFVSVTTIPAAADIGVSAAFGSWSEARGSLIQLLLNVSILVVIGAIGLTAQRRIWRRLSRPAT